MFFVQHEKEGAAEAALDTLISLAESGIFGIIVINSLKCLIPKTELDGAMGDQQVALQARMNNKLIRKVTPALQENDTTLGIIAHKTTNVGNKYHPYVIGGGRGIQYASLLTMDFTKLSIQKTDPITKEEGMKFKISIMKNHCACMGFPYLSYEYYIRFGQGITWDIELFNAAVDAGVFKVAGAWISQIDTTTGDIAIDANGNLLKWQGKAACLDYIKENDDYRLYIESLVGDYIQGGESLDDDLVNSIMDTEDKKAPKESLDDDDIIPMPDNDVIGESLMTE